MTTQRVDGYEHQCGRPCPTLISMEMFQSFQRTGASQAVFDAGIRFSPADRDDPTRGVLRWCAECWQTEFGKEGSL